MKPATRCRVGTRKRAGKLLTAVDLVAAVLAVRVSVAAPLLVNALAGAALDLTGRTSGVDHWLTATLLQRLIRLVGTV